jgi:hypothetical protein
MRTSHGLLVLLAVTACGGDVTGGTAPDRGALGATDATGGTAGSPGADASGWFVNPGGTSAGQVVCSTGFIDYPAPPVWEFVIDTAGSMNEPAYPNTSNPATKWQELERLLPSMFAALPSDWAVGVSYFNQPEGGCYAPAQAVPIGTLTPAQRASIDDSLANQTVQGTTPTLGAGRFGLQQITTFNDPDYDARYIVLVTDGVPTATGDGCNATGPMSQDQYDSLVSTIANEGNAANVRTFVVGVPGSQDPQGSSYDPLFMLSRLALGGGTPRPPDCIPVAGLPNGQDVSPRGHYCHIDLTNEPVSGVELAQNFAGVPFCTFTIAQPPSGQSPIIDAEVVYTPNDMVPRTLTRAMDSSCADGQWYFSALDSSGNPTELDLCPSACDKLKAEPGAGIAISFCMALVQ